MCSMGLVVSCDVRVEKPAFPGPFLGQIWAIVQVPTLAGELMDDMGARCILLTEVRPDGSRFGRSREGFWLGWTARTVIEHAFNTNVWVEGRRKRQGFVRGGQKR